MKKHVFFLFTAIFINAFTNVSEAAVINKPIDEVTGIPGLGDPSATVSSATGSPPMIILGYGLTQMTCGPGDCHVVCTNISFRKWSGDIIPMGTLAYPNGGGSWGHWTVNFSNVNAGNGTASMCIDNGGSFATEDATIGAEHVYWMIYGK